MVCAPIIALVEVVSGGMLSTAIGSALGSQLLGGAVLGLIASGGRPEGAILGGLASAFSGAVGAAGDAAAGVDAVSTTGQLATDTVGNAVSGSADDFARIATGGADTAVGGGAYGATDAASGFGQGFDMGGGGGAASSGVSSSAASVLKDTAKMTQSAGSSGGILSKIEGIAKSYPEITKIGLGAIKGIGEAKMQEDLLEKEFELRDDLARKSQDRAFRGMDARVPFQPANNGYLTPMQRYLRSVQQ